MSSEIIYPDRLRDYWHLFHWHDFFFFFSAMSSAYQSIFRFAEVFTKLNLVIIQYQKYRTPNEN